MKIQLFNIAPAIPEELRFLETLAYNMWWCWNFDAIELFRRIDPQLWREAGHNPLEFLSLVPQKRLESLAGDDAFLRHQQQVRERFEQALRSAHPELRSASTETGCVAYFSLEYGIHESIRTYSGGLGALAGDHLKAASDYDIPMVAIGILYRQGYFQQYLNNDGWQQERYPNNEIHRLPVRRAMDETGKPLLVPLTLPDGPLQLAVWRLDVGRVPLFMLDANIPENPSHLRELTAQLYGGDRRVRLCQELILGVGGFSALLALGYQPCVCHMNEGHAAFVSLARLAFLVKTKGIDLDAALEIVPRANVFTTHTPVPAGNETFPADMIRPYLKAALPDLPLSPDQIMALGQAPAGPVAPELSMTILGLRMAHHANGVSRLHGRVARRMWSHLWPGREEDEIPIRHITNGVHASSWLSPDSSVLYDRYLGPQWRESPSAPTVLQQVAQIPDDELWRAHELNRSRLIRIARAHLQRQLQVRNAPRNEIAQAKSALDHFALTIGFARRFATYKRATLLLHDLQRLEALLTNDSRPVQIIFAGKAHPADDHGKDLIRQIVHFARRPNVARRIVFLENYDIQLARAMVQGVDLWLNTPHRPHEASGTSGMKASLNGVLHASILDGWWCEGYSRECGWAIGHGEEYEDLEYQNLVDAQALYNLLENEIVPTFYDRPSGDLPTTWLRMMKASIQMALGQFTSHRMVVEYKSLFYDPAARAYAELMADNARQARALVSQHRRLRALWNAVRLNAPTTDKEISMLHTGDTFRVATTVHLGDLKPEEVDVEVYYGPVDSQNKIVESHVEKMTMVAALGGGNYDYRHEIECRATGRYGFTTRATPHGNEWKNIMPGFIAWANGSPP